MLKGIAEKQLCQQCLYNMTSKGSPVQGDYDYFNLPNICNLSEFKNA